MLVKLSPFPMTTSKEGRSNLSITILCKLFIISLFNWTVSLSPSRAPNPRVIDWTRTKSYYSFVLSSLTHNNYWMTLQNAPHPISREIRESRLDRLNDSLPLPTHPWITMCLTELEICCIWSILDIHNTDGWSDSKCSDGITWLFNVTTYSVHHLLLIKLINITWTTQFVGKLQIAFTCIPLSVSDGMSNSHVLSIALSNTSLPIDKNCTVLWK